MNSTRPSRPWLAKGALLLVLLTLVSGGAIAARLLWPKSSLADDVLLHSAEKSDLRIVVLERGSLESQKTVDGVCRLKGYSNKIIFIVPEGSEVKKGDVVVRFDSAEIDKDIAQQLIDVNQASGKVDTTRQELEIAKNQGESDIATAQLELDLAQLDLVKYTEGDYLVELQDWQGKIALAEFELSKAEVEFENFRTLVKKGFREPEQLRGFEQNVQYAKFNLNRDTRSLKVLQDYDHARKLREFEAKAEEAERKLERAKANAIASVAKAKGEFEAAKATLKLEEQRLAENEEQKTKCEITAAQDGVLAYANEDWFDSDRRIREGAVVYRRQKIFSLPDMSLLQVKVNVHESVIKKVAVDQSATIRVDAFPTQVFDGTVKSVSQLADSSQSWRRGGVKEYTTVVVLNETPSVKLKPGMTAEVKILVDELRDVVSVPVQAVTEHKHHHFAYVLDGFELVRKTVEIGQSNERMIEIKSGLEPGQQVALDARVRAMEEFRDEEADGLVEADEESIDDDTQGDKPNPVEVEVAESDNAQRSNQPNEEADATQDGAPQKNSAEEESSTDASAADASAATGTETTDTLATPSGA